MGFKEFMEKNGGWILAGLSSIGVVVTSVLTAKEAPKAQEKIREAEYERHMQFCAESEKKIKIAAPVMAPSLISGGLTIGSIVANQVINAKQQNVLAVAAAGYSVLSNEYDQYRKVIRETQNEEVDATAYRMAKMRAEALEDELARYKEENGPYLYSISTIPGLIFEARPADIQEAFLHFNRNLMLRGTNDLAELYAFIGIPEICYNQNDSFKYGWNEYENQVSWESSFVDFDEEAVETGNGTVVRVISMPIAPYDLTVDYSNENIMDHEYPVYNIKMTKDRIEGLTQIFWDQVIKIDHPYIYRTGLL